MPNQDPALLRRHRADHARDGGQGAMPPLVLTVEDCHASYDALKAKGVEFTQELIARYGGVDANFRDPSGNAWKMVEGK